MSRRGCYELTTTEKSIVCKMDELVKWVGQFLGANFDGYESDINPIQSRAIVELVVFA